MVNRMAGRMVNPTMVRSKVHRARAWALACILCALPGPAAAQTPLPTAFKTATLSTLLEDPMQIAVTAEGRVYIAERRGALKLYDPVAKTTTSIGNVEANAPHEDGLVGMALDPGFAANRRLFLFYSPKDKAATLRLARFTLGGDGKLDAASRQDLLEFPYRSNDHSAGGLAFDAAGNLYIGTGDDTMNLPEGVPGTDGTAGRQDWDARKSSANSNDLRGKILRIHPGENGSYTIPEGNLFPQGMAATRPEIFTMGNRNPMRLSIDAATGRLYWAEPGPNARADDALRGTRGFDEVNLAKTAGNYGWPYCAADNRCYPEWDYQTAKAGPLADPAALKNLSPNNTGLKELPAARPALIWYSYTNPDGFPVFGSGSAQAALAGPFYRFDASLASVARLPREFDQCLFLLDWGRGFIHAAKLDADGKVVSVRRFLEAQTFRGPIDMKIGPDGAIYLLTWGNTDYPHSSAGALVKLEYTGPQEPVSMREVRTAPREVHRIRIFDLRGSRIRSGERPSSQGFPIGYKSAKCQEVSAISCK
jgi:cytochrome c